MHKLPRLDSSPRIVRLSKNVSFQSASNVLIRAEEAIDDQGTGEVELRGNVLVRQNFGPVIREVPAVNRRGVPFPDKNVLLMRVRGDFQIAIDDQKPQ